MPAIEVPPGEQTMSLTAPGWSRSRAAASRRPERSGREGHRGDPVEPHLDPAVGERLDHDGDVRGSRARQAGHRVHQLLAEHDHASDRTEDLAGGLEVVSLETFGFRDGRHTFEDEGRGVRHHPDEARVLVQNRADLRVETPAAIEIKSFRRVTAGAISINTASMICGFTARITMSARRISSALSDEIWIPYWRLSSLRRSRRTSVAWIASAGTRFAARVL